MSRSRCAAGKCHKIISAARLYCLDHWREIPPPIQQEIYAAYRAKDRIRTLEIVREIHEQGVLS